MRLREPLLFVMDQRRFQFVFIKAFGLETFIYVAEKEILLGVWFLFIIWFVVILLIRTPNISPLNEMNAIQQLALFYMVHCYYYRCYAFLGIRCNQKKTNQRTLHKYDEVRN